MPRGILRVHLRWFGKHPTRCGVGKLVNRTRMMNEVTCKRCKEAMRKTTAMQLRVEGISVAPGVPVKVEGKPIGKVVSVKKMRGGKGIDVTLRINSKSMFMRIQAQAGTGLTVEAEGDKA